MRRRALVLGAALTLLAPAAAQARDMYATDDRGNLLRFDHEFPGRIASSVPITGLPAGTSLVGIDFRPATGELVGVGTNSVLYTINVGTGTTTPIGAGFTPGLSGAFFGVDFNPVPDALRITSDARQNYRIGLATGNHGAGSPDGALNPGTPRVVGSAYSNSSITPTRPTATTLLAIDSASDQLLVQNPPNAGTLVNGLPLGVDIGDVAGFDIAGTQQVGWMVAVPAGGNGSVLYRVNLGTGRASSLGLVGTGSLVRNRGSARVSLTGLAARQNFAAPITHNIEPRLAIVRTTLTPAPTQRAAYIARGVDPDGRIVRTEWDLDADGTFDDATGSAVRVGLPEGVSQIAARVTDDAGATVTETLSVRTVPVSARR